MLNSILRNHARIDFCDHVVAVVYERVNDRSILMYGVAGDDATGGRQIDRFFPINFVDPIYSGLSFAGCMADMGDLCGGAANRCH